MDIYLLAECRFFLGTDSGPVEVPPLFGKPCAISGSVPIGLGSHYADDIYMPNTYWSENESRLLSFPEAQGSEIRDYISNAEFAAANLKVIGPAAEHITALTQEIMDRLDGTEVYDDLDRQLKERWRELLFSRVTRLTRGQLSSVSRDFLRRNKQLLDDNREAS
jgi:putative glycosyltransferase (TIGR04372 family)